MYKYLLSLLYSIVPAWKIRAWKSKLRKLFYSKSHLRIMYTIHHRFCEFFEGSRDYGFDDYSWAIEPVVDIPIWRFGISSIKFKFRKDLVILNITLRSPGIFIGKRGDQIDKLRKYLSDSIDMPVKISLTEAKDFWNIP